MLISPIGLKVIEVCAALSGIINVWLCMRANIWNWFYGILMTLLFIILCFSVKLYADTVFQIVAMGLQFYGLANWLKKTRQLGERSITHAYAKELVTAATAAILLFVVIAFLLQRFSDSTTILLDACITSGSFVAIWMQANKWVENWLLWILLNIISVWLFYVKGLYLTAGLNILFCIMNIVGYREWINLISPACRALSPAPLYRNDAG